MWKHVRTFIVAALLAACQPQDQGVIPTAFDLNALATDSAATAIALATLNAPTLTPTRSAPQLPPTFTPTIEPSLTPTDPGQAPTSTPPGFNAAGTLFYIFNGDSLARLAGDGSHEELIQVGGPFRELTPSPDGTLLAFVGPGSGTAVEVYITSRDGTYLQRISCLGMANVRNPTWSPDGQMIAFVASPAPEAPMDIYVANIAGSNTCPNGNNQRVFVPLASSFAGYPAWNPEMNRFFYSDMAVYGLDIAANKTYALSQPGGFGPDFSLAHNPAQPILAYLRPDRILTTGQTGGHLFTLDTSSLSDAPLEKAGGKYFARSIEWSRDGRYLLIAADDAVWSLDAQFGSASQVVGSLKFPPSPAFSPDRQMIAYVDGGLDNPAIPQIFVIPRTGGAPKQITFHAEGSITDLIWLAG